MRGRVPRAVGGDETSLHEQMQKQGVWGRARLSGAELSRGSEDIPGKARSHRGCTGWVQSRSSPGTTAAPQSRWLSQSRWRPAGRGQARESQRRVAPPRTPHPEETGRKKASQSWAWLEPGMYPSYLRCCQPGPLAEPWPRPDFAM